MRSLKGTSFLNSSLRFLQAVVAAGWILSQGIVPVHGQEDPAEGSDSVGELRVEASKFWVVEFEFKALRMITPSVGLGSGKVYWYMLYTLSNPSTVDRELYVQITASSDNNKEYADLFLPSVEKAIERKENAPLWGKANLFESSRLRKPKDPRHNYTTLRAGEKRECVAVFDRLDPNANKVLIRVAGLSNEIKEILKEDGARILEQRIRELHFERPGDEHAITLDSFTLMDKGWVKSQTAAVRKSTAGRGHFPPGAHSDFESGNTTPRDLDPADTNSPEEDGAKK